MNIFVAKLSYDTQDDDLREVFEAYGEVGSVNVIMDKMTGRSKGFAFVEMENDEEAQEAIRSLDNTELQGRTIVVKKAEPRGENKWSGNAGRFAPAKLCRLPSAMADRLCNSRRCPAIHLCLFVEFPF